MGAGFLTHVVVCVWVFFFFSWKSQSRYSLVKVDGEIMPEIDTDASHTVHTSLPPCGCSMTSMRKGKVRRTCEYKHIYVHTRKGWDKKNRAATRKNKRIKKKE